MKRRYQRSLSIPAIRKFREAIESGKLGAWLIDPDTLSEIDCNRTAIFLFDDTNLYTGCSDGLLDEDEDFCIFVPGKNHGIAMPFRRLVGWAYKKKGAGDER